VSGHPPDTAPRHFPVGAKLASEQRKASIPELDGSPGRERDVELDGKAAIVTGAGTGVGRATALALARRGYSVLVNYSRSRDGAESTAAEAARLGVRALAFCADVADDAACRAMAGAAAREFGRLDVLVNNAGTTVFVPHADLERVTTDDWERLLAVNLRGPFQCARAVRPALEASGSGEIVNVSSIAGIAGIGSSIPYCASKAALNSLTVTLARALAPRIRVNAVAPGFIEGEWLRQGLGDGYDAVKQHFAGRAPLQRVATPEDVAGVILSIITGPDLVTGALIPCEGGMLIAG
jgi:3-oxoacyl-[acyl-carrier protein] reductase